MTSVKFRSLSALYFPALQNQNVTSVKFRYLSALYFPAYQDQNVTSVKYGSLTVVFFSIPGKSQRGRIGSVTAAIFVPS